MLTALVFAVFVCFSLGDLASTEETSMEKRAQTCSYVAGGTLAQQWPKACASDPSGAYCLSKGQCGCLRDADCFSNTASPYCDVAAQTCLSCRSSTGSTGLDFSDHYWCRDRYPSIYVVDSATGPALDVTTESVAPANYYREVCLPIDGGSCARCNQAAEENGVTGVDFPDYTGLGFDDDTRDAGWGTVFCHTIYTDADAPVFGRSICATEKTWANVGLADKVARDSLTVDMAVGNIGDLGPQTAGNSGEIVGDDVLPDGSPSEQDVIIMQPIINWDGACVPCALYDSTSDNPLQPTPFNYLCSYFMPFTPICDEETASCRECATNGDCLSYTPDCDTDGSASCTGGNNCMASGACVTCETDADCGSLDGGEIEGQPICDTDTGLCVDGFTCDGNFGEATDSPCESADLPNCNDDGTCIYCEDNGDCGTTDLLDDQVCYDDGICGGCVINDDCAGTSGSNCMVNGICRDCNSDADCGPGKDDGLPLSGTPGQCGNNGYCEDDDEQEICNTDTNICEDPCLSNEWCGDRNDLWDIGGGANCQKDGTCLDCGTERAGSPNCGNLDGPDTSLDGFSGTPNQPDCGAADICITPFSCDINADCATEDGNNCQTSGACLDCIVTYTSSTCSAADGGEVESQPNCDQSSRLCVDECDTNADCDGTQGVNCMDNGVCFDCRDDDDCQTGNAWGGDGGEVPGQTICDTDSGLCVDPCDGNYRETGADHPCPADAVNCHRDGYCYDCSSDQDCEDNDGPPPRGSNEVCDDDGYCVDPFTCGSGPSSVDNSGCKANYKDEEHNNCWEDGTCDSCTSNDDCYNRDGGRIPNQPRCDPSTQECTSCQSNADCPTEAANCHEDGLCYDCRLLTQQCGDGIDGPPGTQNPNANCDSLTGICVDFCTLDEHCEDSCAPYCQVERGCCVECLEDDHCPLEQWRGGEEETKTSCSTELWMCIEEPEECYLDSDCSGATPACSLSSNTCVECVFDSHCSGDKPACATGRKECVECTYDGHCASGSCGSDNTCESEIAREGQRLSTKKITTDDESSASSLANAVVLLVALLVALLA